MSNDNKPHLSVKFFNDKAENKRKSMEAGRPIFDDVEKVEIRFAGDKHNVHVAPAHSPGQMRDDNNKRLTYAEQFPEHYAAFKKNQQWLGSGTPLSELPFISVAKRAELEGFNVHTAEALAEMDGANLKKLGMGSRELMEQARAYLAKAAGSSDVTRLAGENAALKEQMEMMQRQLAEIQNGNKNVAPSEKIVPKSSSPFADWDADTIRAWIVEQGGENPHHKCSIDTLIDKADELNATLAKQNEAA